MKSRLFSKIKKKVYKILVDSHFQHKILNKYRNAGSNATKQFSCAPPYNNLHAKSLQKDPTRMSKIEEEKTR